MSLYLRYVKVAGSSENMCIESSFNLLASFLSFCSLDRSSLVPGVHSGTC